MHSDSLQNQLKVHSKSIKFQSQIYRNPFETNWKSSRNAFNVHSNSFERQSKMHSIIIQIPLNINPKCIGFHSKPMEMKPKCFHYAFKFLSKSIENVLKSIQNQRDLIPKCIGIHSKPMENQARMHSICIQIPLDINANRSYREPMGTGKIKKFKNLKI